MTVDPNVESPEEQAWLEVRQMVDAASRRWVQGLVERDAQALAGLFYRQMMSDPAAATLLDNDTVNRRLVASMVAWLRTLFDPAIPARQQVATQRHVGEVHARIGVIPRTVATAGRLLKRALADRILAGDEAAARMLQYVYETVDVATDIMGDSMLVNHARLARSDESYRLFYLSRNLRTERERQRSNLLEWVQDLLVTHYWNAAAADAAPATATEARSPFEQWVRHKAEMLFAQEPELLALRDGVDAVRLGLLPRLREVRLRGEDAAPLVAELHHVCEQMKRHLGAMFDRAASAESGRDEVTNLLSRRYLPAIARREIALAQAGGQSFAMLLLSLRGFCEVRQALGSDAGDLILAQLADRVVESVRASDFVFRVGDDRLLLLVVDIEPDAAMTIASELVERVESFTPSAAQGVALRLTACIGVAIHDGHPDYQRLLERAEQALRACEAEPLRRVVQSGPVA